MSHKVRIVSPDKDAEIDRLRDRVAELARYAMDLESQVAELEEERDAWQSLDGTNWYQRAKRAESRIAELESAIDKVEASAGHHLCVTGRCFMVVDEETFYKLCDLKDGEGSD